METYIVRNDVTGNTFKVSAAEAKLYALGGMLDTTYTVFRQGGNGSGLCVFEIR